MSVFPYPQTDKHINEHTHQSIPRKTQNIINEPTVPYLQARCTNKANTIKARIHNLSKNGDPHSLVATILGASHALYNLNTCTIYSSMVSILVSQWRSTYLRS